MAFSTITNLDVAAHQKKSAELKARLHSSESTTYVTGPTGNGNGEVVLLLGGTGYIGRAVVPELVKRGYKPVVLARSESAKGEAEFEGADVVIGDPTRLGDVQRAVTQTSPQVVISLLSGRRPNDAEECRQVDHEAIGNGIKAAVEGEVKQFIHISDFGAYRPELIPQVYKLQVEGELMGRHHGDLDWTIIRPTAYYPYLSMTFGDVKNGEKYRIFDHGEYSVVNPIAREDLAEFIVNQVLDPHAIGRILPVGGPWTPDNTVTLKDAGQMMFDVLGKPAEFDVVTMASWDKKIANLTRAGKLYKKLAPVAFYLEAAKYWSVVDHVAPAYGTRTLRGFMEKLKDREFPTGSFRERMKSGTNVMPTDI
ncbi:NAD(P)H-binding protein [Nocardioides jishulii]|uniref:Divinyl chlorophyllide a 8-vinyl-reductase, chloroplastic n=1 Tax=Nocardioides jishulii TaxID=2575440 RepID=A0A4U2YS51_9ACTN|nr:NAD(P)H-binding protein [Nocardioides jishulii]QCX28826.1 NAD-dependent epimerase/dehydratase family protein [Nocardioides jishulii]TKI64277.1 NAD-dependent epimerase/dehydratase family protein [Nocardioides jishulii]